MGKLRVLELYSGIGGMHFALEESGVDYQVVAAIDINNHANDVYRHNFPESKLIQRSIESLSLAELVKMRISMVMMSPPCQPFTRVGKQKDSQDGRTTSFFHFLNLLEQLEEKPRYILLENVKGFDTSITRQALLETLRKCSYNVQEFLLTPLQFGVPNSRLRFFLLAKLEPLKFNYPTRSHVQTDLPDCAAKFTRHRQDSNRNEQPSGIRSNTTPGKEVAVENPQSSECTVQCSVSSNLHQSDSSELPHDDQSQSDSHSRLDDHSQSQQAMANSGDICLNQSACVSPETSNCDNVSQSQAEPGVAAEVTVEKSNREKYRHICRELREFLEDKPSEYFKEYLVPEKFFRRFWVMDIVKPDARNVCCFTKGYAHHVEGTGSILQMDTDSTVDLQEFKIRGIFDDHVKECVRSMQLRFFSPREIATIMCFPPSFSFPPETTTIQCYRLLGNSLNVHCVAVLVRLLCLDDDDVNHQLPH